MEQAVAAGTVLDERVEQMPDGLWKRARLLRSHIQPSLLRVEEEWSFDATQGWTCRKRELFLADQLIVKVRPGISMAELRGRLDGLRADFMTFIAPDVCTVHLRESDLDSLPRALAAIPANADVIDYAEGDGVGFGGAVPNDPSFGEQWGANNTGQSGGTAGADVDAPELWDILGSTPGLVIAVLDSGLNFTHPDLLGIAWTNSLEIPGDGIDNDGDGFIDDVAGWDFTNNDNDPTDDHGHGSNVSGIIAANRNNGVGVAGMLAGAKILACKILNSANAGTTSALISATTYARLRGVPVMNMSLQNYPFSSTLNTEFNACQTAGILLSICAGNQGVNNDTTFNYPSCYQHTNIIAVGNHDRTDVRWSGSFNPSNYGPTNVDLFAPGRDILSPVLGTSYAYYTGTSQATPYVTALAGAIKYLNPTWKAPEIKAAIMASVVTRPAYAGICVTGGRFNALNSVAYAVRQQTTNDVDGDRVSNLMEYLAGTRIDDSASRPATAFAIQSGALHLKMPRVTRPDAHLEIQRSTNLVDWSSDGVVDYSTANLLDGGVLVGAKPAEFLRVKASPTP